MEKDASQPKIFGREYKQCLSWFYFREKVVWDHKEIFIFSSLKCKMHFLSSFPWEIQAVTFKILSRMQGMHLYDQHVFNGEHILVAYFNIHVIRLINSLPNPSKDASFGRNTACLASPKIRRFLIMALACRQSSKNRTWTGRVLQASSKFSRPQVTMYNFLQRGWGHKFCLVLITC